MPSSPASSVCSETRLADYGSDLNRDFEYLTKVRLAQQIGRHLYCLSNSSI